MERQTIIIAVVVVVAILLLIVFWPFGGSKSSTHQATTNVPPNSSTSSNSVSSNSVSASSNTVNNANVKVQYTVVNVQYVYTGPELVNNIGCGMYSHTQLDTVAGTLNGSEDFFLILYPSTSGCPLTVRNITSNTPGFTVLNTEPALPFNLPPSSVIELQANFRGPNANYYGPLTITVGYS